MFITLLTLKRVDAHHCFCFGTRYKRKHTHLWGRGVDPIKHISL